MNIKIEKRILALWVGVFFFGGFLTGFVVSLKETFDNVTRARESLEATSDKLIWNVDP